MGKPSVFKMGGAWVWRCRHPKGAAGEEYHEDDWSHAWPVCYSAAVRHASLFHSAAEPIEQINV